MILQFEEGLVGQLIFALPTSWIKLNMSRFSVLAANSVVWFSSAYLLHVVSLVVSGRLDLPGSWLPLSAEMEAASFATFYGLKIKGQPRSERGLQTAGHEY